jgi:segregation and condensation protein A
MPMSGPGLSDPPPPALPARGARLRIEPAIHPDRAAHVEMAGFEGPLAMLLGLIEQRHLDILEVPLGDLAGAYLDLLATLDEAQLAHISAFVAVAAQLILIKSRAILPRPPLVAVPVEEGPDPEAQLRERLILYRRFRDAGAHLAARLEIGWTVFHRETGGATDPALLGLRPPDGPPLDPELLRAALTATLRAVPPPPAPPEVMPRIITLEERSAAIRAALRRAPVVVLQELLGGLRDRLVITVTFLAMLELVKGREVRIEQREPFGPILCRAVAAS